VVEVEGADARCRDDDGRTEIVAIELLDAVTPGDRVLVHAGVALAPAQTAVEAGG
jgi:hydrogenase maturation factor